MEEDLLKLINCNRIKLLNWKTSTRRRLNHLVLSRKIWKQNFASENWSLIVFAIIFTILSSLNHFNKQLKFRHNSLVVPVWSHTKKNYLSKSGCENNVSISTLHCIVLLLLFRIYAIYIFQNMFCAKNRNENVK